MNTRRTAATLVLAAALAAGATAALASDDVPAGVTAAGRTAAAAPSTEAADRTQRGATYADELPANYRTLTATPAYDVPSQDGEEAGELLSGVELESTGRTAVAEGVAWLEVKVPGRTTGWVVRSAVERM